MSEQAVLTTQPATPPANADLRRRLALAGRRTIFMTAAPMVVSLVTQVLVGRQVGRVGFGEYHALGLFVIILTSLGLLGAPAAASQRIAELDEARHPGRSAAIRTAAALAVTLGLALAVIAAIAWPPVETLFGLTRPVPVGLVALASFASVVSTFAVHVLLARLEVNAATAVIVTQPFAVGLGVLPSFMGSAIDGASLAALGFISAGAMGTAHAVRLAAIPVPSGGELARMIERSVHATTLAYPSVVTGWVDRAMIGAFLGPAALGAFVAANTFVEGIQRFTRAIGALAVPAYARLVEDPVGERRVLDSHLRIMAAVFIVSGTIFIAAGGGLLSFLFGEGFVIATTTLRLLAISLLPLGLVVALASQTVGAGTSPGLTRVLLLLVPLDVLAVYLGTFFFHIAGVALADLVVWTVGLVAYVVRSRHEGAPIRIRTLAHVAGVAVPLFVAGWFIGLQPSPWPVSAALATVVAAPLTIFVLVRSPERRILRRLLRPELAMA